MQHNLFRKSYFLKYSREDILIWGLYHSKATTFEFFFCIYFMFRKVTVLSLQGEPETGLNREADDRAKTHIRKDLCPRV